LLGLIAMIDERLPLNRNSGAKVTFGERVAAMIYNGLGFIDTRLYMFPEFLGVTKGLLGKSAHFDTSTLQLYGEYPDDAQAPSIVSTEGTEPKPARGAIRNQSVMI
jgi:hypothetical protein